MDEQPNDTGGRPKILNNMTALIGGTTALVVAVAGLMTATKDFWKKDPQEQAARSSPPESSPADAGRAQAAVSQLPSRPLSYTVSGGDGGSMDKIDDKWVWTTNKDDRYEYEQVSDDGTTTVAVLKQEPPNETWYIRWPNAGGTALQKTEGKGWDDGVRFTPKNG